MTREALFLVFFSFSAWAGSATTIDANNHFAYGANFGWIDWRGDQTHGAVVGEYVCSGYIYSGNLGWINLGAGSPTNGIQYQNQSADDFGVNQDGSGNLSGYAWGSNIGWIAFEQIFGQPKVNLLTGQMSGSVWSANCGWVSISNSEAYVETDALFPGPSAPNGLPVPWLLTYFDSTNIDANSDPTGKGMTIAEDYVAGTNPNDGKSVLRITSASIAGNGSTGSISWSSVPSRLYHLQENTNLTTANWSDSGLGLIAPASGSSTSVALPPAAGSLVRFFRIQAALPLPQ